MVLTAAYRYLSVTMAPKTRSTNLSPNAPADTADQSSQQNSLAPPLDPLALVLDQMALINASLDAQATETAAQRHRDAQRDTPRTDQP
jgi:hypothetical protein